MGRNGAGNTKNTSRREPDNLQRLECRSKGVIEKGTELRELAERNDKDKKDHR